MNVLLGAIAQGLLWAVMAIGVYITYRILDIADLTAEGCFALGGGVMATLITNGMSPLFSTIVALFAGMGAGVVTGILHTRFKIPALLAGILTMTGLYSINLRIMGKASIALLDPKTLTVLSILSPLENMGFTKTNAAGTIGLVIVTLVILVLWLFFNTEIGYTLRATGNNAVMARALGVNTDRMKILGLIVGNSLVTLSSALVAQYNGFADITMGTGTIVIGLSSVIIGEVVFCWLFEMILKKRSILINLISVTLGSILYRIIIAFVLYLGLPTTDLKLFSSIILAVFLAIPVVKDRYLKPLTHSLSSRDKNKGGV